MYAAVPTAVAFHQASGPTAVYSYTHTLVVEAAEMLAAAWGSKLGQPPDSCGSLAMVGLPVAAGSTLADLGALRNKLLERAGVLVWGAGTEGSDGRIYLRLSASVYNTIADYELLRDEVIAILAESGKL